MRYISHGEGGSAEVLRLVEGEQPRPGAGEILIEVGYAGVNRPDLLQRAGLYPPPADASPLLGLEVAGRVAAVGDEVTEWQVGDRVAALTPGGGYASHCLAPAAHALPVAEEMSLATAAALPETWFTVWANLIDLGQLKAGERLLVHGGASGIGLAAIQLARHVGAEVFVTVGSTEKQTFCEAFGAHHVINYREEDFLARIREITAGEGVDVVLDMVGGDYLQKDLGALRRDGRLVLIAFLEGSKTHFDFMPVMMKRLHITGSTMRSRTRGEKAAIRDALARTVWPALGAGLLKTHVCARFPLAQAAEAHRLMESGRHIGKIVLEVGGE
ncbi:NAD(P)H quinone oxidoreductase [Sterolibacterium denitrificans]|uniref:NAD(P)H quinone oxidoreductase n=2 Tax=Sterolibacterium denitrificans TaxID=157592 RepID=A0A7Z7HSK7_9PROT|nr:NAD(P)H-quinone oxidoreductase [Sterolibacterium denitrificans]KYC29291.1 NAD(P)H-quinone oxidoreductase [Sterolibacterium denitrificans]SMB30500.1 NAD(P)H quinone oxidoreductase [Sterolibacterium denitrificans]